MTPCTSTIDEIFAKLPMLTNYCNIQTAHFKCQLFERESGLEEIPQESLLERKVNSRICWGEKIAANERFSSIFLANLNLVLPSLEQKWIKLRVKAERNKRNQQKWTTNDLTICFVGVRTGEKWVNCSGLLLVFLGFGFGLTCFRCYQTSNRFNWAKTCCLFLSLLLLLFFCRCRLPSSSSSSAFIQFNPHNELFKKIASVPRRKGENQRLNAFKRNIRSLFVLCIIIIFFVSLPLPLLLLLLCDCLHRAVVSMIWSDAARLMFNTTRRAIIPKSTGRLIDMTELSHKTKASTHTTRKRRRKKKKTQQTKKKRTTHSDDRDQAKKEIHRNNEEATEEEAKLKKKNVNTIHRLLILLCLFCHTVAGYYRRFFFSFVDVSLFLKHSKYNFPSLSCVARLFFAVESHTDLKMTMNRG